MGEHVNTNDTYPDAFEPAADVDTFRHEGETPAAPTSGLAALRAERKKVEDGLHIDLRVPRYAIPVYVRYKPLSSDQMARVRDRAQKSTAPDAIARANAQLLAECALGVYERDADGNPVGTPDEWVKVGPALAEYLGQPELKTATAVIRALFFTDGDITSTVNRLTEWSGFAGHDAIEEYSGN